MRVTINENEEVEVGDDTAENYYTERPEYINDSVFKCADCKTGTIHQGFEFKAWPTADDPDDLLHKTKRIYLCTNCGKFSSK